MELDAESPPSPPPETPPPEPPVVASEPPSADMYKLWTRHRSQVGSLDTKGRAMELTKAEEQVATCLTNWARGEQYDTSWAESVQYHKLGNCQMRPEEVRYQPVHILV